MRGAILARPAKSEAAVTAPESGEPNSNIRGNSDAQKGVLDRQGEQPNREAERGLST